MFMQRLISTLILVPLVLLILFYAPAWALAAIVLLVVAVCAQECWQLIPLPGPITQWAYLAAMLLCLGLCGLVFDYWLIIGLLVWLLNGLAILTFPRSQRYWGHAVIVALVQLLLIPLFGQSAMHLYQLPHGKGLIVYLLFLIWASDIGAYLTGKKLGKNKLIPKVSPGKSWEGAAGGFVLSMLVALIGYYCFEPSSALFWFLLAAVTAIVSVFGDLFISILKRRCNIKDTGAIIPGHGGILDRLDSLIAALPWFYFGLGFISLSV